ncbi:MAG: L,D-transpeptidase family protein [Phycisphaeraceae bacterium]
MTLSSQTSRPNSGRQYMVSRKRRPKRWPWIAVVVLAAGVLLIFRPWSSSQDTATGNEGAEANTASTATNDADASDEPDRPTPRLSDERETQRRPVPSVTASRDGIQASGPAPATNGDGSDDEGERDRSGGGTDTSMTRSRSGATDYPNLRIPTGSAAPSQADAAAFDEGRQYIRQGRLVEGRSLLSALLFDPANALPEPDAAAVRDMLAHVNEKLVFSPEVVPGDPVAERYRVQSGDLLARIAPQYNVPYQFLERINQIDARRLQAGQPIKVINGPFHARIVKSDYRMDVFLSGPDGLPIYVKSYPVGLGQADSTPLGRWRVEPGKKVVNPDWRNPRTGEYFTRDDPDNPIGEYWLALEGIDDETRGVAGYGIHGTVDPDSIGEQASMGCIRLRNGDIEEVFHMFVGGESTVEIVR